ncbi:MAG: ribonuclease P protein component [Myxococcota bacterium]
MVNRAVLSKPVGLQRRSEFVRVQKSGQRFKQHHMVLLKASGASGVARTGFTVSRKVGNAVVRNQVRRRLREIVRTHPDSLCKGSDYVVVAYQAAAHASFATLQKELLCLLNRARG